MAKSNMIMAINNSNLDGLLFQMWSLVLIISKINVCVIRLSVNHPVRNVGMSA
jgi:hypothetical protein